MTDHATDQATDHATDLFAPLQAGGPELEALRARLADRAEADGLLDVSYRTLDSPVGPLLLAATPLGLVRVAFAVEGHDADEVSSRAASASTEMSAIISWTSWKRAIGRPNWVRCTAYSRVVSRQPAMMPTQPAATETRPLSNAAMAMVKP